MHALDLRVFLDELRETCLLLTLLEDAARDKDVVVGSLLEALEELLALSLPKTLVLHQEEAIEVILVLALFHGCLGDVSRAIDVNNSDWPLLKLGPRVLRDS